MACKESKDINDTAGKFLDEFAQMNKDINAYFDQAEKEFNTQFNTIADAETFFDCEKGMDDQEADEFSSTMESLNLSNDQAPDTKTDEDTSQLANFGSDIDFFIPSEKNDDFFDPSNKDVDPSKRSEIRNYKFPSHDFLLKNFDVPLPSQFKLDLSTSEAMQPVQHWPPK